MISAVKNTPNTQYPSFKGIVKVGQVFVNGVQDNSRDSIKIAAKRLKDLLMKKEGIVTENQVSHTFRELFKYFDYEYIIPENKVVGSTRHFFDKLRIGNTFYLISGEDAAGRINWLTSAIIDGVTAEDFAYRSENAYCPPASMVRDVVLMAVDDLCGKF